MPLPPTPRSTPAASTTTSSIPPTVGAPDALAMAGLSGYLLVFPL